ncbi:pyridoxamine 5'-phosphate oxidase family protein [Winogradskyella alexanderae]|uniref:Pyridoxamine 5'-phosphate oxidase family protein n=1 Tax=Winogradskyella alexanderae TaxID=2877123 RepID=A0ABS7XNQ0_9FLAO|nr:pyridoxamine 5'-phosphate oxidase family protein [Winogradskyella alexanderae]MCA0131611.1 pyridoxamine 5'-phosphate oxidase family protein [Winogradskyella alexanderae]
MNQITKLILHLTFFALIIPLNLIGQEVHIKDSTKNKLTLAAREIIKASGTCALISLDEKSIPRVRIMDPFPPENDFTIWFGTKSESRKVHQIKNNPNVTLYYQDSDASGYVVIHGKAQIVEDEKIKQTKWKKEWEAFYPNKDSYVLIKVSPDWMEILSHSRGIVGDPVTWQTPIVRFD